MLPNYTVYAGDAGPMEIFNLSQKKKGVREDVCLKKVNAVLCEGQREGQRGESRW